MMRNFWEFVADQDVGLAVQRIVFQNSALIRKLIKKAIHSGMADEDESRSLKELFSLLKDSSYTGPPQREKRNQDIVVRPEADGSANQEPQSN